jgi:hypothetical protein
MCTAEVRVGAPGRRGGAEGGQDGAGLGDSGIDGVGSDTEISTKRGEKREVRGRGQRDKERKKGGQEDQRTRRTREDEAFTFPSCSLVPSGSHCSPSPDPAQARRAGDLSV